MKNSAKNISHPIATRKSFLMRLWRENDHASWRVMLQEVGTNKQIKFASWDRFQTHLANLLEEK